MALKRFNRDILVYGGTDLLFRGAQFFTLPLYVRELSVADFGLLALIQGSATLLGMLFNLGANNAVQRYYFDPEVSPDSRPAIVSAGLAQLMVSVSFGVGISMAIGWGLREQLQASYGIEWKFVALALLTIFPDQVAQYSLDLVRLQFMIGRFVLVALIKNLIGLALGLLFLIGLDMGVAGVLLGSMLGSTLALPVGLYTIRSNLRRQIDFGVVGRLLKFGLPFVLAGAAYWVFGSIDRWMLAELSSIVEVGLFSIAFKFAAIVSIAVAAFGQAWSPFAYRLSTEGAGYRDAFTRVLSVWFFALALLAFTVSVLANDIVRLVMPPAYWPSAPMLAIGVCGIALFGTTLISSMGLAIEKMPMRLTAAAWIAAASNVGGNFFLIPRLGGLGAAFSTLISYSILAGLLLLLCQKFHPLPLEWRKLCYSLGLIVVAVVLAATDALSIGLGWTLTKLLMCLLAVAGAVAMDIVSHRMMVDLGRLYDGVPDLTRKNKALDVKRRVE